MTLNNVAKKFDVETSADISQFQRRARLLQSIWRMNQGLLAGDHRGTTLGSRLRMPDAEASLSNFITDGIREVVRAEVLDPVASKGKLYSKPRIFNDLLSSQPLCFNLFGELTRDLKLTSAVVSDMTAGRFAAVESIHFEYSPGRRDPLYLNDRSAFDVFIRCRNVSGLSSFIGIEVKYHEHLRSTCGEHKVRYDEVADMMKCFQGARSTFKTIPLQQIWRDHLLAGIMKKVDGYDDGLFVVLYPKDNLHVANAICDYRRQLVCDESFAAWTIEKFVSVLRKHTEAPWVDIFSDRYIAFDKIDKLLVYGDGIRQ